MLSNFIGGGQVFLHKVRMLRQVISTTIFVSIIAGCLISYQTNTTHIKKLNIDAGYTYLKAKIALSLHPALSMIAIKKSKARVDAYSNGKLLKKNMEAKSVIQSSRFKLEWNRMIDTIIHLVVHACIYAFLVGFVIFGFWSRFGLSLKTDRTKDGSNKILTAQQVRAILKSISKASDLYIGKMPLVKDMETMHMLVTGSTGSGKTNLIHNILPQIDDKNQPAIILDQTGEMIAKYYNQDRGDIIFNPFDVRGQAWDMWTDCKSIRNLEKFADTLIGFNSRKNNKNTNDFWEESAQSIFVDCARYLQKFNHESTEELYRLICQSDNEKLRDILSGTASAKHFTKDNAKTVASIMSVMIANIKPLRFLKDERKAGKFSISEHIDNINKGASNWLFLATDPSTRELTIPINAALSELIISKLMHPDVPQDRKIWFVMDELASFGKFPSLAKLMQEGRKYGACVIAGMQSSSQLFSNYGQGDASNLFGLFKTKFAFQSDDPMMAKLYSSVFGRETIVRQAKNTSFGANTFRDGVSYSEQQQTKPLVDIDDFASLSIGECYVLLPEPQVRLSKLQTPIAKLKNKNSGFIEDTACDNNSNATPDSNIENMIDCDDSADENNTDTNPSTVLRNLSNKKKTKQELKNTNIIKKPPTKTNNEKISADDNALQREDEKTQKNMDSQNEDECTKDNDM